MNVIQRPFLLSAAVPRANEPPGCPIHAFNQLLVRATLRVIRVQSQLLARATLRVIREIRVLIKKLHHARK